jgi:hypothetical protein
MFGQVPVSPVRYVSICLQILLAPSIIRIVINQIGVREMDLEEFFQSLFSSLVVLTIR